MNSVAIMGRMVSDPELKTTQNGVSVTSFTVAIARSYVKPGEERQTDFIDCVAWRNTAEFICRYFVKGQMIGITGSIQTRTYTDKNGNNRKVVEIVVDKAGFTGENKPGYNRSPEIKPDGNLEDFTEVSDEDLPF